MNNMKFYTIGEVCEYLNNTGYKDFYAHNLRYLEKVFENVFEIRRDEHLNRVYVKEDIDKIETILTLKDQGLNYGSIKNILTQTSQVVSEVAVGTTQNEILVENQNIEKFKEIMIEITNSSIQQLIVPKLEEVNADISVLKKQNTELRLALEKKQEEHFKQVDQKLAKWREESIHRKKKKEKNKFWFRKAIS